MLYVHVSRYNIENIHFWVTLDAVCRKIDFPEKNPRSSWNWMIEHVTDSRFSESSPQFNPLRIKIYIPVSPNSSLSLKKKKKRGRVALPSPVNVSSPSNPIITSNKTINPLIHPLDWTERRAIIFETKSGTLDPCGKRCPFESSTARETYVYIIDPLSPPPSCNPPNPFARYFAQEGRLSLFGE